ncbi:prepilin-type N-terminal cleavage/methylation domain-containing protein [Candidatus Saccharibacteria bacterium]|nr:prepilin-type N-terminal cleavage/methylation domain-containing protein [Candidatus Saccharibacteria bacterium]
MKKIGGHISRRGFTIVELLIVIVVLGVLAAITVVAYNGTQTRANNTKTIQGVVKYVRAMHLYSVNNGTYPIEASYPCLGIHPGTSCSVVGGTGTCLGAGGASSQATFDTAIKSVLSGNLPDMSSQNINCGTAIVRGAYYSPSTGKDASIQYYLKGNQNCDGIAGVASFSKSQTDDTTRCGIALPTLP